MYYANDENKKRIPIEFAEKGQQYYCPCCGANLIVKRGEIIAAHFVHKPYADCDLYYSRNAGMGPWHKRMQEMFPEDCREQVIYSSGEDKGKRIADVLLRCRGMNIIIEFQQSKISSKEFQERTQFYLENGRKALNGERKQNKVIWVFDFSNKNIHVKRIKNTDYVCAQWMGGSRIRFLDNICSSEKLRILFYLKANQFFEGSGFSKIPSGLGFKNILVEVVEAYDDYKHFSGRMIEVKRLHEYALK